MVIAIQEGGATRYLHGYDVSNSIKPHSLALRLYLHYLESSNVYICHAHLLENRYHFYQSSNSTSHYDKYK